jgi:hypothetical protein
MLTPAFSSGKLKQMYSTMSNGVDRLMENLEKNNQGENSVDIYE